MKRQVMVISDSFGEVSVEKGRAKRVHRHNALHQGCLFKQGGAYHN